MYAFELLLASTAAIIGLLATLTVVMILLATFK